MAGIKIKIKLGTFITVAALSIVIVASVSVAVAEEPVGKRLRQYYRLSEAGSLFPIDRR